MPWRLILSILIFAVFLAFITLNLDDRFRCDINFGFTQVRDVPVFLTVFISFILGLLFSLPFALFFRRKHKKIPPKNVKPEIEEIPVEPEIDEKIRQDAASAKKRFFSKRNSDNNNG